MELAPSRADLGEPLGHKGAAAPQRLYLLAWLGVIAIAAAAAGAFYYRVGTELSLNGAHVAADFVVFWTAADAPRPYDFEALTAAQAWYMGADSLLRPFAYPPSFLPWLQPFAQMPMIVAYALWMVATGTLFLVAWGRLVPVRSHVAALVAPATLLALIPGQVVFLLGALLVLALRSVDRRPVLAGLLLGLAATIKPQALLLVPVALLAGGHSRALLAAILTGGAVGTSCLVIQGPEPWLAWLDALPDFMAVVRESGMLEYGTTPSSALEHARVTGALAAIITVLAAALGVLAVWRTFKRTEDPLFRIVALNAGTLLCVPYAMPYELALSAPAAAAILLNPKLHPLASVAALLALITSGGAAGLCLICLALIWLTGRQAIAASAGECLTCVGSADRQPAWRW